MSQIRGQNIKEQFQAIYQMNLSIVLLYALPIAFLLAVANDSIYPIFQNLCDLSLGKRELCKKLISNICSQRESLVAWWVCNVFLWGTLVSLSHQVRKKSKIILRDNVLLGFYKYKQLFTLFAVLSILDLISLVLTHLMLPENVDIFILFLMNCTLFWLLFPFYISYNIVVVEGLSWIKAGKESYKRMRGKGIDMLCHTVIIAITSILIAKPEDSSSYFTSYFYFSLGLTLYLCPLSVVLYEQTKNKAHTTKIMSH